MVRFDDNVEGSSHCL